MAAVYVIRKNAYYDSVFLMRVAHALGAEPGVRAAAALMATDANKDTLAEMGVPGAALAGAGPNDLVVVLVTDNPPLAQRLLAELDTRLTSTHAPAHGIVYRSLADAAAGAPASNLAVISVPGPYAGREARCALEAGKHVFLFSDNVPVEQEVELKRLAAQRGLLVMGPDCGTSLIGGVGIGFANRVRRGPVGVVGASGTGIQEFTSLVHEAGGGVSHAIGTGSHDLADAVGGVTTFMALDALAADPATRVIVLISKPGGHATLARLAARIAQCPKPVVGCLLGAKSVLDAGPRYVQVRTIDEAVEAAFASLGQRGGRSLPHHAAIWAEAVMREVRAWRPEQRYLRGLFAGGTFCFQAQQVLGDAGIPVYSNTPLDPRYRLADPDASLEHSIVDLGDDHFTQGKPHPMIDAGERRKRLLREAADPEVAALLLDFVLGSLASPDPAGDLVPAIRQAQEVTARRGGRLTVVASVCGTDGDSQDLHRQQRLLTDAGVHVLPSSSQAAAFCRDLLQCRR